LIAVTAARVAPHETGYILAAVVAASALDLDHLVYVIRDRAQYARTGYVGHLHNARSLFHEFFGVALAGVAATIFFLIDPKLARVIFVALTIHIVQDWLIGRSFPLNPVDRTEVRFFTLSFRLKIWVDLLTILVFGGLWILYLNVPR
jgi:hypothetical protein